MEQAGVVVDGLTLRQKNWYIFFDESGVSRIITVRDGQLVWRQEDRPGEWSVLKPPITYDPRLRQLRAIGMSRPVVLPLSTYSIRKKEARKSELLSRIQQSQKSSPFTALPSMPLCAVEHDASSLSLAVEQERELVDSLKQDRALQRDGSGIADTLKSIAALSKAANIKHSLLPQGTVLQATTLYESLASTANPQTLYSLDEGEMVFILHEIRTPMVLTVVSPACPVVEGEYQLERTTPRPSWRRGSLKIFYALNRWLIGWDSDMAMGRGFLMATEGRFPNLAPHWLRSDGSGGWMVSEDASVTASGGASNWTLVESQHGHIGYIPASHLKTQPTSPRLGLPLRNPWYLAPAIAAALCLLAVSSKFKVRLSIGTQALYHHAGHWVLVKIIDDNEGGVRSYEVVGGDGQNGVGEVGLFRELIEKSEFRAAAQSRLEQLRAKVDLPPRASEERRGPRGNERSRGGREPRKRDRGSTTPTPPPQHALLAISTTAPIGVEPSVALSQPDVESPHPDWEMVTSKRRKTGKVYYRNRSTGERRWSLPQTEFV